jgi:Protein of unknown function (DUF2958)
MEPLPDELREKIPKLYRTREETDPMAWVKFFSPFFNWRWYIIECEQVDRVPIFYGWMVHTAEPRGRLIRSDLASMRAYFGIVIERDTDFVPCPLSQVQQEKGEGI